MKINSAKKLPQELIELGTPPYHSVAKEFSPFEFCLNDLWNSLNSLTRISVITVKGSNLPLLMLGTMMLPQEQQDTCERRDL